MSKIDLVSREWCNLVFEGRNKEYGAYRMRANAGKRQLRAVVILLILVFLVAAGVLISATVKEMTKGQDETYDQVMEMQALKQEPKKEEPKKQQIKLPEPEPIQKVAVKASIQYTIPKIVDDDKVVKEQELKNMDELTQSKAAIASISYKGDEGATNLTMDDLLENQQAGGTENPEPQDNKVYTVVEQQPVFPGGESALLAYIGKNIRYPSLAEEQGVQGVVILRFVVLEDGSIGEVIVSKSLEESCDREAVRVVKSLPRFTPGKQQGRPVKVWFTCPIRFQIL